jgi:hypothetical protein
MQVDAMSEVLPNAAIYHIGQCRVAYASVTMYV